MAIRDVSVRLARSSQLDLTRHRGHCSVDPELLRDLGCVVGQQIRVVRDGLTAVYTIVSTQPENQPATVRLGLLGRRRLGTDAEFRARIDTRVVNPSISDGAAKAGSEFVERLRDGGPGAWLIAIAPHGGDIEQFTDHQALRVTTGLGSPGTSAWWCAGYRAGGGAGNAWHVTSTEINEASFPLLATVIARGFQFAVAFHGSAHDEVLVGGHAPTSIKRQISTAIRAALAGSGIPVRVAEPGDALGGDDRRNIVNRLTGGTGGIQIEQPRIARTEHWDAIADAVIDVMRQYLPGETSPGNDDRTPG